MPAPSRLFDVGLALRRIRKLVRPLPGAAMFAHQLGLSFTRSRRHS